jgi:hypothetical protein
MMDMLNTFNPSALNPPSAKSSACIKRNNGQ